MIQLGQSCYKQRFASIFFVCRKEVRLVPGQDINKLFKGDFVASVKSYGRKDLEIFGQLSNDKNRIHWDEEYASTTIFKKPIVYGMLAASHFSDLFGNTFPGIIYQSQDLKFLAPIFLDEKVEGRIEIVDFIIEKNKIITKTTIKKIDQDKIAIDGSAIVYLKNLQQYIV